MERRALPLSYQMDLCTVAEDSCIAVVVQEVQQVT